MLVKVVECIRLWKCDGQLIITVKHWTELTVEKFLSCSRSHTFKALQEKDITETWSLTEQCLVSV